MTWNHRVIRRKNERGEWLSIHEAYYSRRSTKTPHSITMEGVSVVGENIEELRETLQRMLRSLDKPILDYDKIGNSKKKKKAK
jgi:hypothetical protein